jgi:large subunit ribosomal protein L25
MPDRLEIDLTHLDIGDSLKIGDLSYDNLEIMDPSRAMVAGVVSSRLISKGLRDAEPEEGEEVAEEAMDAGEAPPTDQAPAAEEEESSKE